MIARPEWPSYFHPAVFVTAIPRVSEPMKPEKTKKSRSAAKKFAPAPAAKSKAKSAGVEAAARPRPARQTTLKIPALLLEGDASTAPAASGPGHRYALGPVPSVESFPGGGELPEAYGTGRLLLTARDPHWLYAHWDFTGAEMKKHNARSADGHLVLRVYKNELVGKPCQEDHVHPESRNWFAHVTEAGTRYQAELGYYDAPGRWVSLAVSRPTLTPPDALSGDTSMRFATIPVEVPFRELLKLVKNAVQENLPLVEVIQQLRAEGHPGLPDTRALGTGRWTPAQERALSEVLSMDSVRRVWMGSLEITELIRSKIERTFSSPATAFSQMELPAGLFSGRNSVSSPFGGMERKKSFWFNVNAELIIYGATEPDAAVSIGGRRIRLRPDGTFSFRFALPDGNYELPAVAVSADGDDTRSAELKFSRASHYGGEVGIHPQDSQLHTPSAAHLT